MIFNDPDYNTKDKTCRPQSHIELGYSENDSDYNTIQNILLSLSKLMVFSVYQSLLKVLVVPCQHH